MTPQPKNSDTTDPALVEALEAETPTMAAQPHRRLYAAADLPALLRLSKVQVNHLINTGQLRTIRICGEQP